MTVMVVMMIEVEMVVVVRMVVVIEVEVVVMVVGAMVNVVVVVGTVMVVMVIEVEVVMVAMMGAAARIADVTVADVMAVVFLVWWPTCAQMMWNTKTLAVLL